VDFNEAGDDWVAVASAGPYANHLHLAKFIYTFPWQSVGERILKMR